MNNYILHIAIIHRNLDIVKYLVDLGADLEVNDDFGNTALLIATDEYDPENEVDRDIVMLLINRGANVNAQTATGITPLYHAVNAGDLDLARLLLDRGADVNKIYFNNISVLHLASEYENLDMIRLLLDYGVDSSILDRENRSAEDYLVDMQNDELAQFIRNYTLNVKEPVSTT
jgi:ankyrin repeat protein